MLPNPWILLLVSVVWVSSLVAADRYGAHNQLNADTAATATQLDKALSTAKASWDAEYQAELSAEKDRKANETTHRVKSRAVAVALRHDTAASSCGLSAGSYSVLNNSIDASNGASDATAASVGNAGLRAGNEASGPITGSGDVRPGQHGVDAVGLPPGTEGTARVGQ